MNFTADNEEDTVVLGDVSPLQSLLVDVQAKLSAAEGKLWNPGWGQFPSFSLERSV